MKTSFKILKVTYPKFAIDFAVTNYRILQVQNIGDALTTADGKVLVSGDKFNVAGNNLPQSGIVEAVGEFSNSDYPNTLYVNSFSLDVDETNLQSIYSYLKSGIIKGIDDKWAKRIVSAFHLNSLDVLKNNPEKLSEIKMSDAKIKAIQESVAIIGSSAELKEFLDQFSIPFNFGMSIYHIYKDKAVEKLKANPYLAIMEDQTLSFVYLERIGVGIDFDLNNEYRYVAAILYSLKLIFSTGSTFLFKDKFMKSISRIIKNPDNNKINIGLRYLLSKDLIWVGNVDGKIAISLKSIYKDEKNIADIILRRKRYKSEEHDYTELINDFCNRNNFQLAPRQRSAVQECLNQQTSVLTGGPGVGKTTVLKCMIECYAKMGSSQRILCMAPTGRASSRMSDATSKRATTIHSRLKLMPDNLELTDDVIDEMGHYDLILVDEFSMVDVEVCKVLLRSIHDSTKLVIVGDPDQLPSVGAGNILRDLIFSDVIHVSRLTDVFRQGAGSSISTNAYMINQGRTNFVKHSDFRVIEHPEDNQAFQDLINVYLQQVRIYGINDVVILSALRNAKNTESIAVNALNPKIQEIVNPLGEHQVYFQASRYKFRKGDRVMQTAKGDDVSNGDVGVIVDMYVESGTVIAEIDFGIGDNVIYSTKDEFDKLDLAYATTVHKSQGSEYKSVINPVFMSDGVMLQRNLLYTAVTRAKTNVILFGSTEAIKVAAETIAAVSRDTFLYYILKNKIK